MIVDHIKTWVLFLTLTFLLLLLGFAIGGEMGITIALVLSLIGNLLSYWYSDKIALYVYKAKKVEYSENPKLHDLVKEVSIRTGIKTPKIYLIPSRNPNAFATGRSEKNSSVAFTQGLLDMLSERELKGVIAHEIAHIKNKDILLTTVTSVIAGSIMYVAIITRWTSIFSSNKENNNLLEIIILSILAPVAATLIQLAISRSREYLADETAAKVLKDSEGLGDALVKINTNSQKMEFGNPAFSSLFISNPFKNSGALNLLNTHPSLQKRIDRLRKISYSM